MYLVLYILAHLYESTVIVQSFEVYLSSHIAVIFREL